MFFATIILFLIFYVVACTPDEKEYKFRLVEKRKFFVKTSFGRSERYFLIDENNKRYSIDLNTFYAYKAGDTVKIFLCKYDVEDWILYK